MTSTSNQHQSPGGAGQAATVHADVVVVGSGAGGAVLAHDLTDDPQLSVVIIEAGGRPRKPEFSIPAAFAKLFGGPADWGHRTAPQAFLHQRELLWPRGKVLGGSTSINAQMWVRGCPADYDDWANAGADGWAWDDVAHHFDSLAQTPRDGRDAAARGPQVISELRDPSPYSEAFVAAAQGSLGIPRVADINHPEVVDGVDMSQVTQHAGRRFSAYHAFVKPAMRRPNLRVVTGTAERVMFTDGRATGVVVSTERGEIVVRARREVVLCAGAIESPALLQRSGIGNSQFLRTLGIDTVADRPGVGSNLQDHLMCALAVATRPDAPRTLVDAERPGQLLRYLTRRSGMLSSNVAEALAFVRTQPTLDAADIELVFAPVPFLQHGQTKPPSPGITVAAVLLRPNSRGWLSINGPRHSDGLTIDPNYLSDDGQDLRTMVRGLRAAARVLAEPSLAQYLQPAAQRWIQPQLGSDDMGAATDGSLSDVVRAHAETLYHPVGTARMGRPADDLAVVDPSLRVIGVRGLRVADASVMPNIVRGHTMAASMMIGRRAAQLITGAEASAEGSRVRLSGTGA